MKYEDGKNFIWHDSMHSYLPNGNRVDILKINAVEGIFYRLTIQNRENGNKEVRIIQDLTPFEITYRFDDLFWQV